MILTVNSLSFKYSGSCKTVLKDVSFSVEKGEYIAILGANGSGKSTLLRCIAGLLPVDRNNSNPKEQTIKINTKKEGHTVPTAVVFQSPDDQLVAETAELDAAFGPENTAVPYEEMHNRVNEALSLFLPDTAKNEWIKNLSSGQKQHLALAGAYTLHPEILLLDEPSSMLSEKARSSLLNFLDRAKSAGKTILHITHDIDEAKRADRVIILNDGVLVFDGGTDQFLQLSRETLTEWALFYPEKKLPDGQEAFPGEKNGRKENLLQCKGISAGPLQDISFEAGQGDIIAVTGESGSGKTLLLQIIAGLKKTDRGEVIIAEGKTCALAVQEPETGLFEEFTADDVAFGLENAGIEGSELKEKVKEAMDKAGLPFDKFADRKTFSLSGGEKRKAAVAGIIALGSDIVLLDDPFSALDIRSRGEMRELIKNLSSQGKAVIFSASRKEEHEFACKTINLSDEKNPCEFDGVNISNGKEKTQVKKLFADMPPVMKFLFSIAGTAASLILSGWKFLLVLEAFFFILSLVSGYSTKKLFRAVLRILPWLIIICVIQYFIFNGFEEAGTFIVRFLCLLTILSVFVFITPPSEISCGAEDLLKPLILFKIPVRHISFLISLVFRFIPSLYDEADKITTARKIRTSGINKKTKKNKIKETAALIVPLILRTLTKAEKLSLAATARYYSAGKHTRYLKWETRKKHIFFLVFVIAFSAILIYGSYIWK